MQNNIETSWKTKQKNVQGWKADLKRTKIIEFIENVQEHKIEFSRKLAQQQGGRRREQASVK